MVAPEITTHIWNCNNLAQINTDLVSILYQNFTPTALFPTPSFVLLLSYKLDLYTLYAHQHRFIIVLCSCLLNQMGEKKKGVTKKIIFLSSFTFTGIVAFTSAFYVFCVGLSYYIVSFHFKLRDSFLYYVGHISSFLFILEFHNFAFIFKGHFYWLQNSWLTVFFSSILNVIHLLVPTKK